MKAVIYFLLFSFTMMLGCETTQVSYTDKENPCKDSTYLALKSKTLDSLSNREFQYMMQMESNCRDFKSNVVNENTKASTNKTALTIIGVLGMAVIVGVVIYFATKKKTIEISY